MSLLWGLLGKAPPVPEPSPKPFPRLEARPLRLEPSKPQPTSEDLDTATTLDALTHIYDSLVERSGYNNELFLVYTTRLFDISNKENTK